MRRLLLLASAIGLLAAVFLVAVLFAASSSGRRPQALPGSVAAAVASLPPSSHVAAPALPAPPAKDIVPPAPRANAAPRTALGSTSMILVADPETGRLGLPEPGSQPALSISQQQALARAEAEGLVTLRNADGSETINHEGRFATHSIARVGRDGKVVYGCVQGEGELDHALHATAPAKSAAEVR
jgi:hypothetical protein